MNIRVQRALGSWIVVAAVCLLAMSGMTSGKQNGQPAPEDIVWTVAIYVAGDNDLETYWEGMSLAMLLNIPHSEGVNFVAYVDLMSTEETRVVEIDGGETVVIDTLPEMNFGDGATFQWFLEDVDTRFPANNLAVIAWDHGSAWRGFCYDYTSGDRIMPSEMREAIIAAGVEIDILAFDACACASIEMVYEAAETRLVDLMVASEELVAGNGFPYDLMFTPVALEPDVLAVDVAFDMIDAWEAYYSEIGWGWYATLGVIDVSVIHDGIEVFDTWTKEMLEGLPEYLMDYRFALRDSSRVSCVAHYQVDIVDLGRHLLASASISGDLELAEATQKVMDCVEQAVLYVYNPDRKVDCTGLSIYWGFNNEQWRYNWETYTSEVSFAADTSWGTFLIQYNSLTAGWYAAELVLEMLKSR
jgi:hypothetical protein